MPSNRFMPKRTSLRHIITKLKNQRQKILEVEREIKLTTQKRISVRLSVAFLAETL
jgi:hypothetical protein